MKSYNYTTYNIKELEQSLGTKIEIGLRDLEVLKLQKTYGLNEIVQNHHNWVNILINQLKNPFTYLLILAAVISFFLDDSINTGVILFIIFINVLIGFIQEYRADKALLQLQGHLAPTVLVRRNSQENIIKSRELVPGDIVILKPGDYIPADIRLVETHNFSVNESVLTGESQPVNKTSDPLKSKADTIYQANNTIFWGTNVITGSAIGVVVATTKDTIFGDITSLTINTLRISSFQVRVANLSKFILKVVILTIIGLFFLHLIFKTGSTSITQLAMFAIAIAISVIPEALPLVTTFAMSEGALNLAKHHVLVKRLSAIEDLGSINVLCTDKTGTLTENQLTVKDVYNHNKQDPDVLFWGFIASPEHKTNIDPIDSAIKEAWLQGAKLNAKVTKDIKYIEEIPFDPTRRRNAVLINYSSDYFLVLRGAYEETIALCKDLTQENKLFFKNWINTQAKLGRRTLVIAYKKLKNKPENLLKEESSLTFSGLISLEDPIKSSTSLAVQKANQLGVKIIMLTGDSKEVAYAVGTAIGLTDNPESVITGEEFNLLNFKQQTEIIKKTVIFARISPEQKYVIVNLFSRDNLVGFLGEGINDAPALKAAQVGIVVKEAADIAKEAADIILLQRNLYVIIEGIFIGRKIFANTIKYIKITLTSNLGNFYSVATASLLIDFLPMLPLQILLVNLLSDFPMVAIATDNIGNKDLERPSKYDLKDIAFTSAFFGSISTFFDFIIFALFYKLNPGVLQTNWFIGSILTELVLIFSLRTKLPFYKAVRPSIALMLLASTGAITTVVLPFTTFGQQIFKFIQPTLKDLSILISIAIAYFITTEIIKHFYYSSQNNVLRRNKSTSNH